MKLSGNKYKIKTNHAIGHNMFSLAINLDGTVTSICSYTKENCAHIARKAGYKGEIDNDLIQEVVITRSGIWERQE